MHKLLYDGTISGDLFSGGVGFGGETQFIDMFDIDHDQDGMSTVFLEDLMDLNIVRLELGACSVPTDNLFLCANLFSVSKMRVSWGQNNSRTSFFDTSARQLLEALSKNCSVFEC